MTRPDWLTAALERHAPETERAKDRPARARLQSALRSDRKTERDAAKAEVAARQPAKTPPAKKR